MDGWIPIGGGRLCSDGAPLFKYCGNGHFFYGHHPFMVTSFSVQLGLCGVAFPLHHALIRRKKPGSFNQSYSTFKRGGVKHPVWSIQCGGNWNFKFPSLFSSGQNSVANYLSCNFQRARFR